MVLQGQVVHQVVQEHQVQVELVEVVVHQEHQVLQEVAELQVHQVLQVQVELVEVVVHRELQVLQVEMEFLQVKYIILISQNLKHLHLIKI